MSLRKRHNELPKCRKSERICASECDISENANVLSFNSSSNVEQPQSNTIPDNEMEGGNTCDTEASKKLHMKMKKHSSSTTSLSSSSSFLRKDSWSRAHITSALRLSLGVLVIITFLFSLTQLQNVEGQRDSRNEEHQKKIPNEQ
jgi:hypothetical protein